MLVHSGQQRHMFITVNDKCVAAYTTLWGCLVMVTGENWNSNMSYLLYCSEEWFTKIGLGQCFYLSVIEWTWFYISIFIIGPLYLGNTLPSFLFVFEISIS